MFDLVGKNGFDRISFKTIETCGSGHDGDVYKCELSIVAGCLGVEFDSLYVTVGEIKSFFESLSGDLDRSHEDGRFINEDLNFHLAFNDFGHVSVHGEFDQNNGDGYLCRFGFESDITCVEQVKSDLDRCIKNDDYFINDL